MTGKSFLDKFLRGGLVNAFGQTGGLTGLGPKFSYDATKGFVGSNPIVGGYAGQAVGGDFGQQAGRAVGEAAEGIPGAISYSLGKGLFGGDFGKQAGRAVGSAGHALEKGVPKFAGGLLGSLF